MNKTLKITKTENECRFPNAKILFDKRYAKACIYTIENALIFELNWFGFVESADFRRTLDQCVAYVLEFQPTHWLSNNKQMRVIAPKDQDWSSDSLFPRLLQNDFKKMAIVEAEDIFNKRSVNKIITKSQGIITFDIMYFEDIEEARAWLTAE